MNSADILQKLSESVAEAILEATDDGILIIDTHRNVVKYNTRFLELWRIPLALQNGSQDDALLGLAKAFNRKLIAEGVETHAHGKQLLSLGCDLAQGYGIARPMPPEKLVEWSQKWCKDHEWLA